MKRQIARGLVMIMLYLLVGFSCRAESAVTREEEFEILCKAYLNGQDTFFEECNELSGLIRDIDEDGRLELIIKGEIGDNGVMYSQRYAVYVYDETQRAVVRLGEMGSKNSTFFYSKKYQMLTLSSFSGGAGTYTFYQVARTGLTEEFSLMYIYRQPDECVYTIQEGGVSQELAVTERWNEELWSGYTGELEQLEFWPKWKFEYWEQYGYPKAFLSEESSGTGEALNYADEIVEFEFPERELIPYILAWQDMDFAWVSESVTEISSCTFACPDDESFWDFLTYYVIYNPGAVQDGGIAYYEQPELERIACTAFPGYGGGLPAIPENYNIQVYEKQYAFNLATPEPYTCELQSITVGEGGDIEATYTYTWDTYEEVETIFPATFQVSIHLTDDSDPAKTMGVCYRITGLTYVSGDASYAEPEITSSTMDTDTVPSEEESLIALEQNNYILPQSSERYLDYEDVAGLSLREVNYAKNEIYARAGRRFNAQELQDYFGSQDWYVGIYDPAEFDQNLTQHLNEYEIANGEFLSKVEHEMDANGYTLY